MTGKALSSPFFAPCSPPHPSIPVSQVRARQNALRGGAWHPHGHRRWPPIAWFSVLVPLRATAVSPHTHSPADGFVGSATSLVRVFCCCRTVFALPVTRLVAGLCGQAHGSRRRWLCVRCVRRARRCRKTENGAGAQKLEKLLPPLPFIVADLSQSQFCSHAHDSTQEKLLAKDFPQFRCFQLRAGGEGVRWHSQQ